MPGRRLSWADEPTSPDLDIAVLETARLVVLTISGNLDIYTVPAKHIAVMDEILRRRDIAFSRLEQEPDGGIVGDGRHEPVGQRVGPAVLLVALPSVRNAARFEEIDKR